MLQYPSGLPYTSTKVSMKPRLMFIIALTTGFSLLFGFFMVNRAVEGEFPRVPLTPVVLSDKGSSEAPIQPVASDVTLNPREVALGEKIFQDTRLSENNTISCASCHNLATGGADGRRVSLGIYQQRGTRNAPTVFNCSLNYRQFWDGRAASLAEQMDGPLKSANEMHSSWPEVAEKLRREERYVSEFRAVYPDGLQPGNIKKALTVFERSLTTPDSRFDQYLKGDRDALTVRERDGYHLFISAGCISCHQGVNIGGNMMQQFGVMNNPYASDAGQKNLEFTDHGALILSDAPDNTPMYKVPGLRNVARTAPYFHDGSAPSLRTAVEIMGHSQLGRSLSSAEVTSLVDFLNSLTGKYHGKQL
jgi:cytochrome c peroxidase